MQFIKRLLTEEDGPTAVEYAVVLAAIVMVCIAAIAAVGTQTNSLFENSVTELESHS